MNSHVRTVHETSGILLNCHHCVKVFGALFTIIFYYFNKKIILFPRFSTVKWG